MSDTIQDNTEEFDELKSIWKNQPKEKAYNSTEIFKMIHRRSINSIQWLFIITVIELLFSFFMSFWTAFSGEHLYSETDIQRMGVENISKMENFSHLGLIGSILIFGITFYYYRKISASMSVNGLIENIIRFRKYVMWFIFGWIVFLLILIIPLLLDITQDMYLNNPSTLQIDPDLVQEKVKILSYFTIGITIALVLIFSALYYGIIYGVFLRRLGKNLKELKKIKN